MGRSYFSIKAHTTAALAYFLYNIMSYTVGAMDFVWRVKIVTREDSDSEDEDLDSEGQDSVFEDLDTEEFPLSEKCPAPPP